jgi:hypothetical protein
MSRRSFWIGHVSGLALGVVIACAMSPWFFAPPQPPQPTVISPGFVPVTVPSGDLVVPPEISVIPPQKQIPHGWQEFEFNGKPVYIIPLSQREIVTAR